MQVLADQGLKPRVPAAIEDFADPAKRDEWFQQRNMLVFQLWHPMDAFCTVDVFTRNPIAFDSLWQAIGACRSGPNLLSYRQYRWPRLHKDRAGRLQDHPRFLPQNLALAGELRRVAEAA
jgi:hypothetical protein